MKYQAHYSANGGKSKLETPLEGNNRSKLEREIIMLRYGVDCEREYTQKEVAEKLNISQSYISRLEKKIIKKLKKEMSKVI